MKNIDLKNLLKMLFNGTIEKIEIINEEIKNIESNFNIKNLDNIFKIIIQCATFEILYKPNFQKLL